MNRKETIAFFSRVEKLIDSLNRVDFPEDYEDEDEDEENEGEKEKKKEEKPKGEKKKKDNEMVDEDEGDFFEEAIEKNGDGFERTTIHLSSDFGQKLEKEVGDFYRKVKKGEVSRLVVIKAPQKYVTTQEDREGQIFLGCSFFFLQDRFLTAHLIKLLRKRTKERSANIVSDVSKSTHIITKNDDFEAIVKIHAKRSEGMSVSQVSDIFRRKKVLKTDWIETCIKEGRRVDHKRFELVTKNVLSIQEEEEEENDIEMEESKRFVNNENNRNNPSSNNNYRTNTKRNLNNHNQTTNPQQSQKRRKRKPFNIEDRKEKFFAGKPVGTELKTCINQDILDKLTSMKEEYGTVGDTWRNYSYGKAINIIRNLKYRITSGEQAKRIHGIGDGIAQKIHQFLTMGKIPKLEFLENDPKSKFIAELTSTHGIGRQTALDMWSRGYRDVGTARREGKWSKNQLIGLKYKDELKIRIPRAEVEEIGGFVEKEAKRLSPTVQCTICGSYRRGAKDCGDVDVLITDNDEKLPNDRKRDGYLRSLTSRLEHLGMIIETLNSSRRKKDDGKESETFMGICRLSHRGAIARRLDIKLYARECYPHALLYFTGCDRYNRSMRLYARKKGFSMSDKGIRKVIRNPIKPSEVMTELEMVKGLKSEREVVEFLGLPWKEPHQRNYDIQNGGGGGGLGGGDHGNKKMRKDMF